MMATRSLAAQSRTPPEPKHDGDDTPDTPPTEPPPVPITDPLPDTVEPGPYVTDEPEHEPDASSSRL
jgi:hypothetical protein